jgi:HEAT repeat protein
LRRSAARALGLLGSEAASPGLLKALDDHPEVRWRAAEALGQLGSEAAIPGLLKALDNQDSEVRWRAAVALGQLGSEAAIPGLLKALDDQDSEVRGRAAVALGQLGSAVAIIDLWRLHLRQPQYHLEKTIFAIQDRCKFYNYEIWQATVAIQNAKLEIQNEDGIGKVETHLHFHGPVYGVAGNVEGNQIIPALSPDSTKTPINPTE